MNANAANTTKVINETTNEVAVTSADLPLACPRPGAPLWARHPRVFIDVLRSESGEAACPYCGTRYRFTGERPTGHH
ncbi:MAG: zinc-finger domain-containing protein [Rhodocyclaceae bacterium]|nr:zinc-finger domain-containing protein [Rhodocyclaceae bacterium]MBP7081274.1 zinc-finger domain-containing protein [Rhodocyclaceae bacterium]